MELRHLTYFCKVVELRSVSKAAGVLHMTQPSLSRQIIELERELDYKLFERNSRGVEPTAAGTGLYKHMDAVFGEIDRIPEVLRTAAQNKTLVRVGVPQGLPHEWFLTLLNAVEEQMPNVALSLHEASTDEQRQLLQNRLIDLGLIHLQAPEASSELLLEQAMGIAVLSKSPSTAAGITFAQMDGMKVMAHAIGEIAAEEFRLRSASLAAGANIHWVFRRFSEHSWLIAKTADVDAVLLTEASARRHLHGWTWTPIQADDVSGGKMAIRTWATWNEPAGPTLRSILDVIRQHAH